MPAFARPRRPRPPAAHRPDPANPRSYITFCLDRVDVLTRAGVTPVVVFDGGRLPAKAGEEGLRQR